METKKLLKKYDYSAPAELIAQKPAHPRDLARILIYDKKTGVVRYDTFRNLGKYLPPRAVLVFNRTKVVPARFQVVKSTGGKARVLYLGTEGKNIRALSDRALVENSVVRVSRTIFFTVIRRDGGHYILRPSFPVAKIFSVLERYGTTPIPPYIKHSPLTEKKLRTEYQTVFASRRGSVAAPTASLHFTPELLRKLRRAGHKIVFVTLHVNLGTFAPLTGEQLRTGKLHREWCDISSATARTLNQVRKDGHPVVAVGTTVARTLESVAGKKGMLSAFSGETDIFIRPAQERGRPGYKFRFVDALVTNFHVPRSSLMMLVSALTGTKKLLELYRAAIRRKFRLFSFGDGMLIK